MGVRIGLDVEHRGDVSLITMNRPPANYIDLESIRELADGLDVLAEQGCRVAVLASGAKHFCAGADLGAGAPQDRADDFRRLYQEAVRLFHVPIPVVAAVRGAAVGGGLGLACAADFRVTVASARFHANFASLGFHHGFGLSVTLPRLVGAQKAAEMLYTAAKVDGAEACALGLADRLVDGDDPLPGAIAFAEQIAASAPLVVRSMKATMREGIAEQVAAATEREFGEQSTLWPTEDCRIGLAAATARIAPVFVGR